MTAAAINRGGQMMLAGVFCVLLLVVWWQVKHPLIALVLGAAPIALMAVLRWPFPVVLLFVVFSFFRLHEVIPQLYSLKIPLLLSLASIAALAWHVAFTRSISVYWNREMKVFLLFFVLVVIGVVMASNRPIALAYFKGIYWKIGLMTVAIAWLTRRPGDFRLASLMIVFSGALVGVKALLNKAQGIGMVEETRVTIGRELGSVLGDPNDLALVLMFPAAFAVSLALTSRLGRGSKILGWVTVPILFAAVIATQSRGGLLGIMAVFGFFAWRKVPSKSLLIVLGLVAALVLHTVAGISDRSSGGAAEEGLDASAMGRLYAWEAAFGMALHNPLTGVGLDNFYSNYYYYSAHWDGLNHAVHSTWFGVLAETGFLGLGVFVAMIVVLLRSALRALQRIEASTIPVDPSIQATAQAAVAGLGGTVVSGTFLTQGFTWPIYILAAFIIALSRWIHLNLVQAQDPAVAK